MAVSTSRVKFEETLLKHKNDFLEILKNVHDVINNATSLDDAFFDKITPFGMNVLNLFASLLQLTNVNSRSELENIWKSHYHNESTREMIDEWLEAEDDWNNTLHDIDSKCLIQYTNEHQPDTPDVAVGSLMCDAELIEVKSGKTMTLKDHALSVQKCFRHQTLWFVANYLRTRGTLISLYEGDDIFQSGGDAVYDCKTKKVLHMYRGMDSSDRISVEALSIANVGLDVRKRPRVVALSPVRSGIRVRSDISCDISFTRARVFTSRPADLNLTWHTENPDFTDCFQNTALVWIPVAFLFIVTPYELWMQSVSRVSNIPWNSINILKLLFLSIQTALSVSMIVCNFISWEEGYLANTIAHFLLCLSYFYENNLLKFSVMLLTLRKRISNPETLLLYVVSCILARNSRNKVIFVATKLSDNELVETWKLAIDLATFPIIVFHVFLSCYPDHIPTSNKDKHLVKPNSTPEDSSSVLSQITFWWLNPLVIRGYKQPLVEEDQWSLAPRRRCVKLYNRFQHYWQAEISKRKSLIISYISSDEPVWRGVFYAIILFLSGEILSLFESQYLYLMHSVAAEFRSSLIAAIYKKALVISNNERKESTVGEIVNLMSVDTQHFLDLMPFLYVIWSAPLQIILAIYFLWRIIGPSALTGIAIMVFTIPLKGVIANITHKLQITNMALKDERTKMMNEILNGIRVLKLYAWEIPFIQQVLKVRSAELRELRKMAYMNASTLLMWTSTPFLVAIGSFATFIFSSEENILTPNIAFVSLSLFSIMRFPLAMLPQLFSFLIQTAVSVKRLNKFMRAEELDSNVIQHDSNEPDMIRISNASFTWGEARSEPVLKDISLKIKPNSLVAIVGRVGAGKSSLISAILGELHKTNGSVNVKGDVAYFPQTAWIRNASVKENIIMHKKRNEKKYQKIIYACGLKSDLQILPGGDNTEIGEKGINLSGGQKQRVSLARAVYSEADIVLLDDPLSAVDAHVGKHIFDNVIGPDGILNNTTRVMVTHGLSYLPQCDNVIVMEDGRISEAGSYNDLVSKNGAFAEFLIQYMNEIGENTEMSKEDVDKIILNEDNPEDAKRTFSLAESDLNKSLSQIERSTSTLSLNSQSSVETTSDKAKAGQLIDVEEVDTGDVNWSVYKAYAKTIGITLSLVFIFAWLLSQTSFAGSNIWLSEWSNDLPPMNGTINSQLRDLRLGVYAALGLSEAIFVVIGGMGFAYGTVKAGEILHENMLQNIMRSPMSFFDTTPMGRILNRFSKDINDIDVNILWSILDTFQTVFKVILTIIVISIQTPMFLVAFFPMTILYYFIQRVYLASSRQLKRLESKTRSPIFIHFSESLTGASSIRAYKIDKELSAENDEKVDLNLECYLPSIQINRWLSLRVELLGNLIILFSALFAVLSKGTINAGAVGLSVSYAITVSAELNWLIRMSSELETNMVSVERILEYSDIEEEAEWRKDIARPSPNWPSSGKIEIKSYSTRYRKGLDLVLKNVSCEIEPLEKIGVCGRTGAGKSSLTLALFRIIESAGGKIIIDDIDISNLGLHDLRSKLTIIPQDPFLFSGTLKRNLDPFNNYSESDIWIALEHAHLKAFVGNLQKGLEFNVAEGGENLSVGQRQLICLARALLRKTRILILDEATAAVDLETDELIQETIRREFKDCTIITIAHRLNTIMDNSRVMVLDQGQIAEFDTPHNLLKIQDSIFYTMAKDAGLI
ncbi:Multidrug resistance-associated protein 1 [Nymphon striatum]|nr:Multidrug resistance-associated protein 1 [Nymphon striatum]